MQKFYVIFSECETPRWYSWFLDSKYRHAWAAKAVYLSDGTELLIAFENLFGYISLDLTYVRPGDISELCPGTTCIVEYQAYVDVNKRSFPQPITCITVLKKLLGIHKLLIQTPKQLKEYLLRQGGTIIWER